MAGDRYGYEIFVKDAATGELRKIEHTFKGVDAGAVASGKSVGALGSTFGGAAKKIAMFGAAYLTLGFAYRKISSFMSDALRKAQEQEAAEKKLAVTYGDSARVLYEQASALQRVTAFGDEAILGAQTQLGYYRLSIDAVKTLTPAMLDMAVAGIDMNTAAMLIGKSMAGVTTTLSRYGIVLTETQQQIFKTGTEAEKAATLVEVFNSKFGGQAAGQIETYGGRVAQLTNAWGDLKEEVGLVITTHNKLTGEIGGVTGAIYDMTDAIKDNRSSLQALVNFEIEAAKWGSNLVLKLTGVSGLIEAISMAIDNINWTKWRTLYGTQPIDTAPMGGLLAQQMKEAKEEISPSIMELEGITITPRDISRAAATDAAKTTAEKIDTTQFDDVSKLFDRMYEFRTQKEAEQTQISALEEMERHQFRMSLIEQEVDKRRAADEATADAWAAAFEPQIANMRDLLGDVSSAFTSTISSGLAEAIIEGEARVEDYAKALAKSVLQMTIMMALQHAIKAVVVSTMAVEVGGRSVEIVQAAILLGTFKAIEVSAWSTALAMTIATGGQAPVGGGAGGAVGTLGQFGGGLFGGGLFGGALEWHSGGLIRAHGGWGVMGDEVPIIAQRGEYVMPRAAVREIGAQNVDMMSRTGRVPATTINVNVYGGNQSPDAIANAVVERIRRESRRGVKVINQAGVETS